MEDFFDSIREHIHRCTVFELTFVYESRDSQRIGPGQMVSLNHCTKQPARLLYGIILGFVEFGKQKVCVFVVYTLLERSNVPV